MKVSIIIPVYYNEDTLMMCYQDLKEKAAKRKEFFDIKTTIEQIDFLLRES